MMGTRHWMEVQPFSSTLHGVVLERPWLTGKGVSTRKPGPMTILRKWPLYIICLSLLHISTHLLITWSCGNRPVMQAIFFLIASGFPRHLAHVQNEERKAFMGVKFYKASLIYKTDCILMGGCEHCLDHGLFCAINLLLCIPEMGWKTFLLLRVSPLLCYINLTYSYCILVLIKEIRQHIFHK